MNYPKISVIIPVYNPGEWLHECMQSVLGQSLRDIEIICIDDGSTDDSLDRLNEYASADSRVKVLSQSNSGAAVARNKGLSVASGEFVAFMDPDDFYPDLNVLSTLYSKAIANSVDVCGGCMMQFFPDGRKVEHYSGINSGYEFTAEGIVAYCDYQFEYGYTRFIYRRKTIVENDIRFPELMRFQDPPFFVEVMAVVKRFYAIPIITYCYRATNQAKKIDWTSNDYCRARHYVRGMMMVLELAIKNELNRLRVTELERLFNGGGKFLWQDHIAEHIHDDLDEMMKKYMPLVSVIVPAYNVEKYIGECLDSLLAQRYHNLEVICINDGSTDGTLHIIESYYERFSNMASRLIVHSQENRGLSAARNAGLEIATGKYIYFLDSDDKIVPEAIAELVVISEREKLDQVIFSSDVFTNEKGELIDRQVKGFHKYYTLPNAICGHLMTGDELFHELINLQHFHASQPLRFYRVTPLKEHGCRFPVGMLHEDNYFAPLSLRFAKRAIAINRRYYQRRVRSGSIMTSTCDRSPRLHGLFGVIIALCTNDELWESSDIFRTALRRFISTLCQGLGWHCNDTPMEKWGDAVRDIMQDNGIGSERIITEFVFPLLRDRVKEGARANKAEKRVALLEKSVEEVVDLRHLLTSKDARIDDLEKRIKLRIKEIVERNQLIAAKDARIDRYIKQLADLRNSWSYRFGRYMTWPIRKIQRVLKKVRYVHRILSEYGDVK